MKIAVIGYGGVGKAFVKLLVDKKQYLQNENLDIKLNYVIDYYGGIYNPRGIDCEALMEFTKSQKDITKFTPGI